jgi:hypothetical protein
MTSIAVPRMTRVTWCRHRAAVLAIIAVFGVAIAFLIADGVWLRTWVDTHHIAACFGAAEPGPGNCSPAAWLEFNGTPGFRPDVPWALIAVAPVLALFAGLPWVTREFDTGTFRYTWVQGVSPRRWLLGTFGSLAVVAAATAVLCGVAFGWWFQIAQWQGMYPGYPWYWEHFELTPLSMACWMLLAFALALVTGVAVRRTVPAMAAFMLSYGAWLYFSIRWLQPHLLTIAPVVKRLPLNQGRPGLPYADYVVNVGFAGPGGHQYGMETVLSRIPWNQPGLQVNQWLAEHHLTYWISYQPASRIWSFQLAWAAILLTIAAASVLAAVYLLRKRPAQ